RKRCSSRTVTPHRAAWRRRISSNRSRKTWNVWGVGVSTAAWKSAYCSVPPSGRRKLAPHFLTKPAAAIASSAPSVRMTSLLHGSLRFADVEAGEPFSLQQDDAPPAPRQRGGRAG